MHRRMWSAIARLHCDKLFVGLEVVVLRQHTGRYKLLLKYLNKVQQVLGLAATDIIDLVGWNGKTILICTSGRSLAHHTYNSFNNVVNLGEVAAAVAVVADLDSLATQQFAGEAEVGPVWPAGRTIDGEEP